jgi:hypothetical protein
MRQDNHKVGNRGMNMTAAVRRAGIEASRARAAKRAETLAPVIKELQASGTTSLSGIAAALNARGILTPLGCRHWYASSVAQLLKRLEG